MNKRQTIWLACMIMIGIAGALAQDTSTPPADASPRSTEPQQPYPAYGQQNLPSAINENPPLSGMDVPSLEPNAAPLSYLQPGATISESADSNAGTLPGGQSFSSISRALANLTLRRLWSHYDLGIDYQGGVGYYTIGHEGVKLLQQMDLTQKVLWKRGQLSLRDSFSYLPEGNFGTAYGSLGSVGLGTIGGGTFGPLLGGSALGSFGLAPRILNVSVAEVTENLTPKSSITALGGYAFTHFYEGIPNEPFADTSFIGVSQTSAQAGYNRILSSHSQIALVYAYQGFDFSIQNSAFHTNVVQALYGHRISGRMDFLIGAGPQFTRVNSCFAPFGQCLGPSTVDTRIGVAGLFRLRYKFPKTMVDLSYHRYETSGAGFFAGAQSDIAKFSASRPLSRVLTGFVDIGYSHNHRLQNLSQAQLENCVPPGSQENPNNLPTCPGVDANTYQYGFIGAGVHRQFGHEFHGFMTYQFNELAFDHSFCAGLPACSRISNRQVITFGLDWTPRPIRLD